MKQRARYIIEEAGRKEIIMKEGPLPEYSKKEKECWLFNLPTLWAWTVLHPPHKQYQFAGRHCFLQISKTKSARSTLQKNYFSTNLFWVSSQTYFPNKSPKPAPNNANDTLKTHHPKINAKIPQNIAMIFSFHKKGRNYREEKRRGTQPSFFELRWRMNSLTPTIDNIPTNTINGIQLFTSVILPSPPLSAE